MIITTTRIGLLAKEYCNKRLELQVLRSGAGSYIGTLDDDGPCSRESEEYFKSRELAESALVSGDWTQRYEP